VDKRSSGRVYVAGHIGSRAGPHSISVGRADASWHVMFLSGGWMSGQRGDWSVGGAGGTLPWGQAGSRPSFFRCSVFQSVEWERGDLAPGPRVPYQGEGQRDFLPYDDAGLVERG
jgi:hypothetical protein